MNTTYIDNLVNLLLEIQYGRLNIDHYDSTVALVITFQPDGIERQTWFLFNNLWAWETKWNNYLISMIGCAWTPNLHISKMYANKNEFYCDFYSDCYGQLMSAS